MNDRYCRNLPLDLACDVRPQYLELAIRPRSSAALVSTTRVIGKRQLATCANGDFRP